MHVFVRHAVFVLLHPNALDVAGNLPPFALPLILQESWGTHWHSELGGLRACAHGSPQPIAERTE